jgi:hypothetical protein
MLNQTNYPAVEQHFHCDICSEAITNPLCPLCLTGEVEAWLTLYPNLSKELLPRLKKYLEDMENRVIDYTQCIKCNNKQTNICPYCFTDHILGELKKLKANKVIFKEFLQFFNYEGDVPNPHAAKWARDYWSHP